MTLNPQLCCRAWAATLLQAVTAVRATAPLQPAALDTLAKCRLASLTVGTLRSIHRDVCTSLEDIAALSSLQHLQLDPCLVRACSCVIAAENMLS